MLRQECLALIGRWTAFLALACSAGSAPAAILVGIPNAEDSTFRSEFINYDRFRADLKQHDLLADYLPATLQGIKEFNVILYPMEWEPLNVRLDDPEGQKRLAAERETLEQYVREGGGLVVLVAAVRYPGTINEEYYNRVFGGFGLRIMHEGVWDAATAFTVPESLSYPSQVCFQTTNVTPHPVTEGVRRLAMPQYAQGAIPGVEAVAYDSNWSVVVAGAAAAKSYKADSLTNELKLDQPGSYTSAPPIVAVRQYGKGRVVAYSMTAIHVHLNYDNPIWYNTTESKGDAKAGQPSDGQRLIRNALRWAGETSQGMEGFGTREIPAVFPPIEFPRSVSIALHPRAVNEGAPVAPPVKPNRGIIGLHSARSDGQGTVREYADAARAAGLDFLVFSEALENLTAEKWAALVADCKRISQETGVYLCPGYEYSDVNDCRWAMWGEKVIYPAAKIFGPDGKKVFWNGQLAEACAFPSRMLLTYDKLPGDPGNLNWFFRMPIFVYNGEKLVAEHLPQYLQALDDYHSMPVACFTRIRSPQEVAGAANRAQLAIHPDESLPPSVSTFAATWFQLSAVNQGGVQGPQVELFTCANPQSDYNLYQTAGGQRARCYFRVYAPAGLKEIRIHDGMRGVVRRYLPQGARDFRQNFEIVHDRQHNLVLEAFDTEGRRAVSSYVRLYSYKQGLFRCGDNHNILCTFPIYWTTPAIHSSTDFPLFEDASLYYVKGIDGFRQPPRPLQTGTPFGHYFNVSTTTGNQGPHFDPAKPEPFQWGYHSNRITERYPFASMEVVVAQSRSDRYVDFPEPNMNAGPFVPLGKELEYATLDHRMTLLFSRINNQVALDNRRWREGTRDYAGDVFLHEGIIRFKKDGTLKGETPIELQGVEWRGMPDDRQGDTLMVTDREKGAMVVRMPDGGKAPLSGNLAKGGYITGLPTLSGSFAVVPVSDNLRWRTEIKDFGPPMWQWLFVVGVGHDGQTFKAGDVLKYSYLAVTLPASRPINAESLARVGESFGLTGPSKPALAEVGKIENTEVFLTAEAKEHEFLAMFTPWPMIVNRPLRIRGVEENGTAAVYVLEGDERQRRFRFVGVFEGAALFQQNLDQGGRIWVGNVFYAEDNRLKLTLVLDGLTAEEKPFLEIHNPTDQTVSTRIQSPPHTPLFANFSRSVTVPAGSGIRLEIPCPGPREQPLR